MINLKSLLTENVTTITTGDIYNFYFLFSVASYQPEYLKTDYGQFIQDEYLTSLKNKYLLIFKNLLQNQIQKYINRKRVDQDFPTQTKLSTLSSIELLNLMKKTFRSDLKRRNTQWEMVCEFLIKLENATTPKDIYLYLDRLNSIVHNTQTQVLGKISHDLVFAYDKVHHAKSIKEYQAFVNKDIRNLLNQDSSESAQLSETSNQEQKDYENGRNLGFKDKMSGQKRELTKYSKAFVKGYNYVQGKSGWDGFNSKITDFIAHLGISSGNR